MASLPLLKFARPGVAGLAYRQCLLRLGAHLAFVDESGYLLIPPVRRTWGPRGVTPIIRYCYKHYKISAISAVTVSPTRRRLGLYCPFHRKNIQQAEVCRFLRHVLRHLRGPVIVIWGYGKPHKDESIRELCRRFPRLHLERFPAYAPELNPDEGVWSQMDNARPMGALTTLTNYPWHSTRHSANCANLNLSSDGASASPISPLFLP